jgi:hypothetical protein
LGLGLELGLGRTRRLPLPTGQGELLIFWPLIRLHFLPGLAPERLGAAARNGIKAAARPGLGAQFRASLLPGLAPVVLVFKDPIELVFHPTTQASEPAAFAPVAAAGAWAGARHAINQLAARTHQAI